MFELNKSTLADAKSITEELGISNLFRGLLIVLMLVIISMGFIGNLTVLISSLKYKAIELDEIDLIFLENIAAADFMITLFGLVPMFITICGNAWILGNFLCSLTGFIINIPGYADIFLLMGTSCYRAWRISCPLSVPIESRTIRILVLLIWRLSAGLELIPGFFDLFSSMYEPLYIQCDHSGGKVYDAVSVTLVFGALVVIVVANILIFTVLNKANSITMNGQAAKRPTSKAAVTILSICSVFIVSYFPFVIFYILSKAKAAPMWLPTFCQFSISLNVILNPVIYTMTNKRFGRFIKTFLPTCVSYSL